MKPESTIQREVMLAASAAGWTVWRNNCGKAYQGLNMDVSGAEVILPSGSRIHVGRGLLLSDHRIIEFGLCPGSSDLIGIKPLVIGPEHVGTTVAQFAAIEVKSKTGRASKSQRRFLGFVEGAGGVAVLARSAGDLNSL